MEGVRTKKSIYNMTASIVYSVISLCFRFLVRRFFLDAFGITILGYYSTFNSIVGMLNMAELGIGTAIAFNLYKPAAEGDYNQINSYLNIYKKLYKIIGLVILVLGIVFIPFLPTIVGEDNSKLLYLGTIFVLQLLSTVATYWFSYKRIVYTVYQDSYYMYITDLAFVIIMNLLQIAGLILLKNYYLYLIIDILCVFGSNFVLSLICKKKYPCINCNYNSRDNRMVLKHLLGNIKDVIISKIGGYVLNSTDAIVISLILGASVAGYMANYSTIFTSFQTMILTMLLTIQPSLGNKIYTDGNKKDIEKTVINITFVSQMIASVFSVVAFFVANDFITIWLGQEYVLDNYTVFFFALNVYVFILMYPISVLYGALGYFKYDKIMICISAAINIVISVLLVFKFGVFGVLVGTNVSLNIYWICRTIILYKRYYEFKSNCYLSMILRCLLTTCFSVLLIAILNNWLNFYLSELFSFLIKGTIYSISVLAINVLFFYRTSGFKYMIYLIKRFLNKRRKA